MAEKFVRPGGITVAVILAISSRASIWPGSNALCTGDGTIPVPMNGCDYSLDRDGYLHLNCTLRVKTGSPMPLVPIHTEIMTLQAYLTSDEPVKHKSPEDDPECISVRGISLTNQDLPVAPVLLTFLKLFTYEATYEKPFQFGEVRCVEVLQDGSCKFLAYGFANVTNYTTVWGDIVSSNHSGVATALLQLLHTWRVEENTITNLANFTFTGRIRDIPSKFLAAIAASKVERLAFHRCAFTRIGSEEIPRMPELETLEFFAVPIVHLHASALKPVSNVRSLLFNTSRQSSIPKAIFTLHRLELLVITDTDHSRHLHNFQLRTQFCNGTVPLLSFVLRRTYITNIPSKAFCDFPRLRQLDLRHCHTRFLLGDSFHGLRDLEELNLGNNRLKTLPAKVFADLISLKSLILHRNVIKILSDAPLFSVLPKLDILDVSHNKIADLRPTAFVSLTVAHLKLSRNRIVRWSEPIFSRIGNLRSVDLRRNEMTDVDDLMFSDLSPVREVVLCENPWDCGSCAVRNLQVLLLDPSHEHCCRNCCFCQSTERFYNIAVSEVLWDVQACTPKDLYVLVGFPCVLTTLTASLVSYGVYVYRWYFVYFFLFVRTRIGRYKRLREEQVFEWDAFLSYHSSESGWVRETLLPRLEAMGFRLCLAERDFIAGVAITENICRSITFSRKSVFLLTERFLRSRWCVFEVSLAQHRLFDANRGEQLVLLKKGPLPDGLVSPVLQYLLRTRTYVAVPNSFAGSDADNFWLQVKIALQK